MPVAKVRLPDGRVARFEVPEGTTPDQVVEFAKSLNLSPKQSNAPTDYRSEARKIAQEEGVDPDLFDKLVSAESSWNPNAKSKAGALGLGQLMPGTAKDLGVDPLDPMQNLRGSARYLAQQLRDFGTPELALAAYNAGPGTVRKSGNRVPNYPETIAYIEKILGQKAGPTGDAEGGAPEIDASMIRPEQLGQIAKNAVSGPVRGVGSIMSTAALPFDLAYDHLVDQPLMTANRERRQGLDQMFSDLGVDTDSVLYQGGKLGAEIMATAPFGRMLGAAAESLGAGSALSNSLATGGFNVAGQKGVPAILNRLVGGAVTGGASAGAVDPEIAGYGAVIGGGLPIGIQAIGGAGRAMGRAFAGNISPERAALARRAGELGIDIPADRIADSKPMNALAASLNYVPFSGRAAAEGAMYDQTKRAVSRTFGQDSPNVTQAIRSATKTLGDEFDRVLRSYPVQMDQQFLDDIVRVLDEAGGELGDEAFGVLKKQAETLFAKGADTGAIDGRAAYYVKKALDRIGNSNDSSKAYHAGQLKKTLMSALNRSLPDEEAARFAEVRRMYGNMLDIQNVALNGADGNVSVARLANMRNINNRELQELADISSDFLKARESPHGAAQRVFLGGLAGGAGLLEPNVLAAAAAGAGVGRAANSMLNSQAARNFVLQQGAQQPSIPNNLVQMLPAIYQTPQFAPR